MSLSQFHRHQARSHQTTPAPQPPVTSYKAIHQTPHQQAHSRKHPQSDHTSQNSQDYSTLHFVLDHPATRSTATATAPDPPGQNPLAESRSSNQRLLSANDLDPLHRCLSSRRTVPCPAIYPCPLQKGLPRLWSELINAVCSCPRIGPPVRPVSAFAYAYPS